MKIKLKQTVLSVLRSIRRQLLYRFGIKTNRNFFQSILRKMRWFRHQANQQDEAKFSQVVHALETRIHVLGTSGLLISKFPEETISDLVTVNQCKGTIEPEFGYIRFPNGKLHVGCFHSEAAGFAGFPQQQSFRQPQEFEGVISLRDPYEVGFYHFLVEVTSKLYFAEQQKIPEHFPYLVGSRLWDQPYFQELLETGFFGSRKVVEHTTAVASESIFFVNHPSISRDSIQSFASKFTLGDASRNRRLMIRRRDTNRRHLTNFDQLFGFASNLGFELFVPDDHSVAEQAKIFSETRFLIAEHGAGVSNAMFRIGYPLSIIEMFQPHWLNRSYLRLASVCGFEHYAILGQTPENKIKGNAFFIPETDFELTLKQCINNVEVL